MSSSTTPSPAQITPSFIPNPFAPEPPRIQSLIKSLQLAPHPEGGYFHETDRASSTIPSPFPSRASNSSSLVPQRPGFDPSVRNTSTSIFYLLTPRSSQGDFHRNAARTVHTLHRGRGRYVIIHADEDFESDANTGEGRKRVETFVVGQDVEKGERLQWIVEGGKYKASFLLEDEEGKGGSQSGLLISESVVPGFEFCDHDFLTEGGLKELLGEEGVRDLGWLLRRE